VLLPHSITVTTPPSGTLVSLAEIKSYLLIEHNQDDELLLALLASATEHAQRECGLYFLPQTVEVAYSERDLWKLDEKDRHGEETRLEIPVWPMRSLTSISYLDTNGATQTWAADKWQLWVAYRPPLLSPVYGERWPGLRRGAFRALWLSCAVGAASASVVPDAAKQAIKLIVAQNYGNKGDGRDPSGELGIPPAANRFLSYLRQDFYR
jgi:uncharacterized phiE125 gp8 family phage protein